jgi:hypothetical protein
MRKSTILHEGETLFLLFEAYLSTNRYGEAVYKAYATDAQEAKEYLVEWVPYSNYYELDEDCACNWSDYSVRYLGLI